jgi:hypothetical protein
MKWNRLWTILALVVAVHITLLFLAAGWIIQRLPARKAADNFKVEQIPARYDADGKELRPAETLIHVSTKTTPEQLSLFFGDDTSPPPEGEGNELDRFMAMGATEAFEGLGLRIPDSSLLLILDARSTAFPGAVPGLKKAAARIEEDHRLGMILPGAPVVPLAKMDYAAKKRLFGLLNDTAAEPIDWEQALTLAFAQRPDAILIVSDGRTRNPAASILEAAMLARKKWSSSTVIHAVWLESSGTEAGRAWLAELAARTGGTFVTWQGPGK